MKKNNPPNTFRYILPVSLFVCIFIFYYFFGWLGYIIGILIALFLNMVVHSIIGVRYWNYCRALYESLIKKNHTKKQALIEISKRAHPELKISTHAKIANKFNDVNLLVNFITGALPPGNNSDEFALEILEDTFIQHLGGDKYRVATNRKRKKYTKREP